MARGTDDIASSLRRRATMRAMTLQIGMLLFPQLTQLDFTGPYEVLWRLPDAQVAMRETSKRDVTIIHDICPILPLW